MQKILRSPVFIGLLMALMVSSIVIALQASGQLELAELTAYDCYIRLQPAANLKPDDRIVLIEISENDIQALGRWPLTDAMLSKVLEKLAAYGPRVIGLDIYRDLSVPPGTKDFERVFCKHDEIIPVMKFGGGTERGIAPPPCLRRTERFGFKDIVVDPGGIVRRGLLFLDDGESVFHSFSLRLVLQYLSSEGITPQPDPLNPEYMRLGNTTIRRFQPNDGAYVGADARGYQYLMDYRGLSLAFPSYSLTSLLKGDIKQDAIHNKIVVIGTIAEGVKDFFYTPFSRGRGTSQQASGVSVHAAMASQLLHYALDGRIPLRTIPRSLEWTWVLLWGLAGAMLGIVVRSPLKLSASGLAGLIVLAILICVFFLSSYWLPFVPPALVDILHHACHGMPLQQGKKRTGIFDAPLFKTCFKRGGRNHLAGTGPILEKRATPSPKTDGYNHVYRLQRFYACRRENDPPGTDGLAQPVSGSHGWSGYGVRRGNRHLYRGRVEG